MLRDPPCPILFWKRYVDDIITAVPSETTETLLDHLNTFNENIQFRMEEEVASTIVFLDLKIHKENYGSLSFKIHRKESNTGRYLDYNSYHPKAQRRSVARSLY
jgi:hypothetical protein